MARLRPLRTRSGEPSRNLGAFLFYDTVKIILLLIIIGTAMGIVNAYFPIERLRRFLSHRRLFGLQYLLAALFGAVTPFCSCSSIPLFIGFVKGGIPLGVTFAFLITSPLVNEVAVALLLGSFGVRTTLIYVASGLLLGTVGDSCWAGSGSNATSRPGSRPCRQVRTGRPKPGNGSTHPLSGGCPPSCTRLWASCAVS